MRRQRWMRSQNSWIDYEPRKITWRRKKFFWRTQGCLVSRRQARLSPEVQRGEKSVPAEGGRKISRRACASVGCGRREKSFACESAGGRLGFSGCTGQACGP